MSRAKLPLLVALSSLTVLVAAGCEKSVQQPSRLPPDAVLGDTRFEQSICPSGGTVEAGPVVIQVPEGAVDECVTFVVSETDDAPPGHAGKAYEILVMDGVVHQSLMVTLYFAPDLLAAPFVYGELQVAGVKDGAWAPALDSQADGDAGKVSAPVSLPGVVGVAPLVKIDLIWMVDKSFLFCAERKRLARHGNRLFDKLQEAFPRLDLQVAAVSSDVYQYHGEFVHESYDYAGGDACAERRYHPCISDDDCVAAFGKGWECSGNAESLEEVFAPNGSVWSTCSPKCGVDQDCCSALCPEDACGKEDACQPVCQGGATCEFHCNPFLACCMEQAPLEGCEGTYEPVLHFSTETAQDDLDRFNCLAQPNYGWVSPVQYMEQGFRSVWEALDPTGPNPDQAAAFVRPDAFLVASFFAQEDDCSIHESFASPSSGCEDDKDCPFGTPCLQDAAMSQPRGCGGRRPLRSLTSWHGVSWTWWGVRFNGGKPTLNIATRTVPTA